jgi:DNA-binding HxlR family transcriptional regulator
MTMILPDVLNQNCGSRQVLNLLADRWTLLVIYALARGTKRYSELEDIVGGISQKMLTQTLRSLERNGIVTRTVYPVIPPKVEYSLTPLGLSLIDALTSLCTWAEGNVGAIEDARVAYDTLQERT